MLPPLIDENIGEKGLENCLKTKELITSDLALKSMKMIWCVTTP